MHAKDLSIVFVVLATCIFHGCSLIGLVAGRSIDARQPEQVIVSRWGIDTLQAGTTITILLNDSSVCEGEFLTIAMGDYQEYTRRFNRYLAMNAAPAVPQPSDTIIVRKKSGDEARGQVVAYDYSSIAVRYSGALIHQRYDHLMDIDFAGTRIDREQIVHALQTASVPLFSSIVIARDGNGGGTQTIHINDIVKITYRNSHNHALYGFLGGACVDALLIIAFNTSGGIWGDGFLWKSPQQKW